MKNLISLLLCLTFVTTNPLKAIDAYFGYNVFHIPGQGPMIETYLNFFGESMIFETVDDSEQATVEITLLFIQEDSIVQFSKKTLHSSAVNDSIYDDFLDQQRFMLDYGEYVLEIELRQPANPDEVETLREVIQISPPESDVHLSDIQWISAYKRADEVTEWTKAGYDLLPFVSNYVPREMNQLVFYAEIYGTDQAFSDGEPFLMTYQIENFEKKQSIASTVSRNRMNAASVIPVLKQIDISEVPSGNFNLVIEIRDRNNELIAAHNRFFQRVGTVEVPTDVDYAASLHEHVFVKNITDIDTLFSYIRSLTPIAGDGERSLIGRFENHKDLDLMQRFFYNFWVSRNSQEPAIAWDEYFRDVKHVERTYAVGNKRGYETDMGRIYLTYGRPDVITDRPAEPSSYPYQIWQYYRAGQWTNVRCVFYDRTLLQSDYELLHCDKIPGEIKNPRWDMLIHQRDTPLNNVDRTQSRDHFGGRTQDMWETPR